MIVALVMPLLQCSFQPSPHTSTPPAAKDNRDGAAATPGTTSASGQRSGDEKGEFSESGIASWYGQEFHGKETSNGETYDMFKLTAAHQTLPFHTLVEVTNLENNRRVVVRINDRGPFAKGRIIDLSYKAAQELGIDEQGTAQVTLRILNYAPGPMGDKNPVKVLYFLQGGAFQKFENAKEQMETIRSLRLSVHFSIWKEGELFKIFSEKTYRKADLEEVQLAMAGAGISCFIREIH